MSEPRLSLCMIVRDEAELLPRFLQQAAGLWDELVVVDTGSRDGTVALLEAAGAHVLHRAWDDDFAAARNAGLEAARGAWILCLDADEMVEPAFVAAARAVLDDERAEAATLLMRNPLPHGHVRRARLLRMFRRDPAIRFRCPIHEEVDTAVQAALARTGRRVVALGGEVLHLGYVRARAAARDKKARDAALLERCVQADPRDLYSWFKLLELARFWSDDALLAATAARAQAALAAAGPQALAGRPFGGELLALLAQGLHGRDPAAALRLLDAAAAGITSSAALHLARAEACEKLARDEAATAAFEACLALAGETADLQLATVRPRMGLCRLRLAVGDLAGASEHVVMALAANPRDPEALLAAVAIARARGAEGEVTRFAERHRAEHPEAGELDEALGEEALLAGRADEAVAHLARAAGEAPQGDLGLRLAQALLSAGRVDRARALALALMPAAPEAGLGVLLCDLVSDQDSDLDLDLEPAEADVALRRWVDALLAGRRAELVTRLRNNLPAVAPLFPWLPAHLAARAPVARHG